jgi:BirA family biotin operon repressor/biotin-[acetyl-CoA-carboxylase] ligase
LSSFADVEAPSYDGVATRALGGLLGVPRLLVFDEVGSTMDVAHALAADGAPAGTLVLADAQRAGRGRAGRRWTSEAGAGIWLTFVERPVDAAAVEVLSLRLGLEAADAVEPFAPTPVLLKWPNDVHLAAGKLAGVLVEARWQDARPAWVAIGVGMNVRAPSGEAAAAFRPGVRRLDVLAALVPALRRAARASGPLTTAERAAFERRDLALGRRIVAPAPGTVRGLSAGGDLLVETDGGAVASFRHGSLVLAPDSGAPGASRPER